MIQIFGTYLGFGFLFWGVIWATNLHNKIAKKWAQVSAWEAASCTQVAPNITPTLQTNAVVGSQ